MESQVEGIVECFPRAPVARRDERARVRGDAERARAAHERPEIVRFARGTCVAE